MSVHESRNENKWSNGIKKSGNSDIMQRVVVVMSLADVVYVRESKSVSRWWAGLQWHYESPILRNISSSVLNATGLTRLATNECQYRGWGIDDHAYYPLMPASNALRLSSSDDIPVKAKMTLGCRLSRVLSSSRISTVAPSPAKGEHNIE